MKMNKKKIIIKIVFIIYIVMLIFITYITFGKKSSFADSGFGVSYDSGGGSSYSSGSDYNSGSISSGESSYSSYDSQGRYHNEYENRIAKFFLILIWSLFVIGFLGSIIGKIASKISKSNIDKNEFINKTSNDKEIEYQIKQYIPDFDKDNFLNNGFNIYCNIQNIDKDIELETLKNKISESMYSKYKLELNNLMEKGQKKVFDQISLEKSLLKNFIDKEDILTITVVYVIEACSYIINKETQNVIIGSAIEKKEDTIEMKFERKKEENANWILTESKIKDLDDTNDIENQIKQYIPDFNKEMFLNEGYNIFCDIQKAWMNFKLDEIKDIITNELLTMYEAQLSTLEVKGEQNIMKDFELQKSSLKGVNVQNNTITITTNYIIEFYDYIIKKDTESVIRGNAIRKIRVNYEMKFRKNLDINKKVINCPNCGANVEMNTTEVCQYCHTKLVSENTNWVLTEKTVINQEFI